MTVGPISQFWDIAGWKLPRRLITVLLLSWIILSLLFFLAGELKEIRIILYKITSGKPFWFYVMAISWFVLILYFLYAAAPKIVHNLRRYNH